MIYDIDRVADNHLAAAKTDVTDGVILQTIFHVPRTSSSLRQATQVCQAPTVYSLRR